jgi:1-deoxy-D-xylulose 5-phosphate reductoisomerase
VKAVAILGSTGSIGVTTLDVVERFRDRFRVVAMGAGSNLELLVKQIERHRLRLDQGYIPSPSLALIAGNLVDEAVKENEAQTRVRHLRRAVG